VKFSPPASITIPGPVDLGCHWAFVDWFYSGRFTPDFYRASPAWKKMLELYHRPNASLHNFIDVLFGRLLVGDFE
jgi:hypothetical protein